jgi:hypothetical protein
MRYPVPNAADRSRFASGASIEEVSCIRKRRTEALQLWFDVDRRRDKTMEERTVKKDHDAKPLCSVAFWNA